MRQVVSSGSPWEPLYGYSRAVRVENQVFVSGTTAGLDADGNPVAPDDFYGQMSAALKKIESALTEVGASMADVVRTRTFVTDVTKFDEVARAHREYFGDIRPAATLVEVKALVDPGLLIEIEVDAVIGSSK